MPEEVDLGALAPRVCRRPGILADLVVGIGDGQALGVHAPRGHKDDPGIRRQVLVEKVRHQDRSEDVHRHGQLMALRRFGAPRGEHPGIVDDAERRNVAVAQSLREVANAVQITDVAPPHAGLAIDEGRDLGALVDVADHEMHRGSQRGQLLCVGRPDPRGRPGHQDVTACEGARRRIRRPGRKPRANRRPDQREAGDHRAIEHAVEPRRQARRQGLRELSGEDHDANSKT